MSQRKGTVPLSALREYQIRPHRSPERVAELGDFYIVDAWLRPSLTQGHAGGMQACYLVDFTTGDDLRSCLFVLEWSPLREKVVELIVRGGSPVGACRLISKPLYESLNLWVIVGVEDDGTLFDPLQAIDAPERSAPDALTR